MHLQKKIAIKMRFLCEHNILNKKKFLKSFGASIFNCNYLKKKKHGLNLDNVEYRGST